MIVLPPSPNLPRAGSSVFLSCMCRSGSAGRGCGGDEFGPRGQDRFGQLPGRCGPGRCRRTGGSAPPPTTRGHRPGRGRRTRSPGPATRWTPAPAGPAPRRTGGPAASPVTTTPSWDRCRPGSPTAPDSSATRSRRWYSPSRFAAGRAAAPPSMPARAAARRFPAATGPRSAITVPGHAASSVGDPRPQRAQGAEPFRGQHPRHHRHPEGGVLRVGQRTGLGQAEPGRGGQGRDRRVRRQIDHPAHHCRRRWGGAGTTGHRRRCRPRAPPAAPGHTRPNAAARVLTPGEPLSEHTETIMTPAPSPPRPPRRALAAATAGGHVRPGPAGSAASSRAAPRSGWAANTVAPATTTVRFAGITGAGDLAGQAQHLHRVARGQPVGGESARPSPPPRPAPSRRGSGPRR